MHRLATALVVALLSTATAAPAETLKPDGKLRTAGDFSGKRPGKPARDVSGLACMPAANGAQRCLLINDEGGFAQFAMLAENRLRPGATLPILADEASDTTLGRAPTGLCRKPGDFAESDGEAVAYADGAFYVAGSHGCSRKKGEFRLSAFHLARIRVGADGAASGPVELTYRLSDALSRAGEVAPFFGKALMDANGINIEGLTVIGDTLWAGLRAPSLDGRAFIVAASVSALFAPGHAPASEPPRILAVPAGAERGIRDLSALPDGRLLALVGPAQEQDRPYSLLLIDPARPEAATQLGDLPPRGSAKAESLTALPGPPGRLDLLIGYDGPRNGHFERYSIGLPGARR